MARTSLVFVLASIAACGPRIGAPPSPAVAPPTASASTTAPAASIPPLVRGADYALTARTDRPKLTELPGAMGSYWPSPIGSVYLIDNATIPARVVTKGKPIVLAGAIVYRHAFSPTAAYLATNREVGGIQIWSTSDGKLLHTLDAGPSEALAMPDDTHVHWYDQRDCRLHIADLSGTPAMTVRGDALCGSVRINDSAKTWYVVSDNDSRITLIDDASGASHRIDASSYGETKFVAPWLSNDGARICFKTNKSSSNVCTRSLDGRELDVITPEKGSEWGVFDPSGNRYAALETEPDGSRWLVVADFAARTVRRVMKTNPQWSYFYFLGNGDRIIAGGLEGAVLADLAGGWTMTIVDEPKTEVTGGSAIPGEPEKLVIGKAVGNQPSFFWYVVEIPSAK